KTNTLAHRVANLIVRGADPRRILLLTFSRRAAAEMTRRVERITAYALKDRAGLLGGLAWSGTLHPIRARLLREDAPAIPLAPASPGHAPRGFGPPPHPPPPRPRPVENRPALPRQGHVPVDLLARRQCRGAARGRARQRVPLVRRLGGRAAGAVRRLCGGEAAP